jgi:hypothetical protein
MNSIEDWINNLDDVLTSYPYCNNCDVHQGFYNAEKAVYPQIKQQRSKISHF